MNDHDVDDGPYEIYAIRYATDENRTRRTNFSDSDPHDASPMPMDFYVWLIRSEKRTVLVDTGFNAQMAALRRRTLLRCPIQALEVLNVTPEAITDVILTHLHYDHAGNLDKLPNARFHLQDDEMSYATGRCMCMAPLRHPYALQDMIELMRKLYSDRVVFHDGDSRVAPGIDLLRIGGHSRGLQSVRVATARGPVVLASDASHYYEHIESDRVFPIVHNVEDTLAGYRKVLAAAPSLQHVVPGHDPAVRARYPALAGDAIGIACLHLPPTA